VTPPKEQSQAGPLGHIPEEGIVTIRDVSTMRVTGAEDPTVGQDVKVEDIDINDPDLV
jgi:hypothetical protein